MMRGLGTLGEFATWRLENGEMPARLLLKEVLDVVGGRFARDFRYTLARDGNVFTVSIVDPGQNQVREIQEALDTYFSLDTDRDKVDSTLQVPAEPLNDALDRQCKTEAAD